MRKRGEFFALAATFLLIIAAPYSLIGQTQERDLDRAPEPHSGIRLTILYPSVGTIKALLALRDQGLLPTGALEIVGVYHTQERTNYEEAKKMVREGQLSWIQFHEVSATLTPESLFKANAASREFADIFGKSDGLIFFGGPDIPPSVYGAKTSLLTGIEDPYRHYFEVSFIFHLLGGSQDDSFRGLLENRPDFPVLAICLGCQTLNVGTGGTLVQDIWTEVYGKAFVEDIIQLGQDSWHTNPWRRIRPDDKSILSYMIHPVALGEKSKFRTEMGLEPGDHPSIMSSHHQAALKLGKDLVVAATSLDGKVVEAIEHTRFPNVLGTQFHPEFPIIWDADPKYKFAPADKELFAVNGYLKAHPPSLEFEKKLWTWFFGKLRPAK